MKPAIGCGQLVKEDGKLVAVLVWCAATGHLQVRDETVGWAAVTRSKRLKLVVQLRRFLVLEATRRATRAPFTRRPTGPRPD